MQKNAEKVMRLIRKLSKEEFEKLDDLIDDYDDELEASSKGASNAKEEDSKADAAVQQAAAGVVSDIAKDKLMDEQGKEPDYAQTAQDESALVGAVKDDQQADANVRASNSAAAPGIAAKSSEEYDDEIINYKKELADKQAEIDKIRAELDAVQRKQWKADDEERIKLDKVARLFST